MAGGERLDFCTEMKDAGLEADLTQKEKETCEVNSIDGDADTQFYRDVEACQMQVMEDMEAFRRENPDAENSYWGHKFSEAYNSCDPNSQLYPE